MASLKTQIEAGASYTDLAALADQLAADYTAVQEAADALSQSQTEAESANSALQLANQTFQKAVEEYNTKVTEANEKIAELTDELEKLSDACDEAERNETTAQPALLQQYEEAVLEGKYADTEYEASLETLQSAVDEAQDTLDELKEQQSALLAIEDGVVCADRDGTLASVTYEAGDTLIKNTAFASYYDLDTILISVEVSQNDIAKLAGRRHRAGTDQWKQNGSNRRNRLFHRIGKNIRRKHVQCDVCGHCCRGQYRWHTYYWRTGNGEV